jgi:ribonuclease D
MPLITDTETLHRFCADLHSADWVTVDTEFIRETTFWPRLCLVQVAGPDGAKAIDTLADGIDLAPLFELMADRRVLKVFHAARQDLEIFHHLTGQLPAPVFDTQVAAMVLGFGDSVGYETIVRKVLQREIDKGPRFTDWALRPLSDRQIDYALADVTHLREVYKVLAKRLEKSGRAAWVDEEMAILTDPATYEVEPMEAWRRLKARGAKGRALALLQELAAWRETEARRLDVPRNRVLRDEALVEIAHSAPKDAESLARTRGLSKKGAEGAHGQAILAAVRRGLEAPKKDWPKPERRPQIPEGTGPMADLLKVLLKTKSEQAGVASRLIATAADVELLAGLGEDADVAALKGWRRDVFGEDALRLCRGEIGLAVVDGRIVAMDTGGRLKDVAE